ncbi:hypothetical protein TBLA_0J00450 [Henningerozyma blattae CBS 6284]|uniref:YEATS domain-containing protein n=1 Tax=Henningerozyma blattae (strain ATCC 34711 / CBS 6284 / DSM 70876 / NBRC 10599 / NRRL Y-10934 / UCD 77-7) TaxID=1071380 RepID=I2H9J3_HENB6|nr:hypothetical protein TBLA_0J00450 [Tetrapisispora blattae CBS 6284]CCH63045.1 hypothetical protein TBLA_0J00450 [Tetrapisispora blattae CBS 6284]
MNDIPTHEATLRVRTIQHLKGSANSVDEYPIWQWSLQLYLLDKNGTQIPCNIIKSCEYILHPSFEKPNRIVDTIPYLLEEEGWGEFNIKIKCQFLFGLGLFTINHDINFDNTEYLVDYSIQVPYNHPMMYKLLIDNNIIEVYGQKQPKESQQQKLMDTPITPQNSMALLNWIKEIPSLDEQTLTEIVQMIINHPAMKHELSSSNMQDDFRILTSQLPDDLLEAIQKLFTEAAKNDKLKSLR